MMNKQALEFLKKLLTTPTPSGFESQGQKIWCQYARKHADEVFTDNYGNAIAVLNPKGKIKIMLDGHADEIGLIVKHIDDKGFIYFQRIGGVDPALVPAKRVNIHTEKGIVRGVVGATAIHLVDRTKERKAPKMHELFVDIGAKDGKDARKKVAIGDPMTFVDDFEVLSGNIAVARAFDNRVGTWAVIETLRLLKKHAKKLNCAVYACSSIQEEVGCIGALMNVFNIKPDAAIAVDVTHSTDTPGINQKQHGEIKMGQGPTISIGRENHPILLKKIKQAAKKADIPLQVETFSVTGGTDAMSIYKSVGGVPSAILGIPNRYMHSTVEMLDMKDLQRTADLLAKFALEIKPKDSFKVKI